MERIQPPSARTDETQTNDAPASRDPARLRVLVAEAAGRPAGEQIRLAGEINALLTAMRAPGNEAAEAHAVLAELELASLQGLVDDKGRSCRAEAVETLLACGFPHALEVPPADLAHHTESRDRRATGPGPLLLAGALVALTIFGLLAFTPPAVGRVVFLVFVVVAAVLLQLLKSMRR